MSIRGVILHVFFAWVIAFGSAKADSIEVSGAVFGSWMVDTVNVVGDINVRESKTLIIDQGVTVVFKGAYYFRVSGCLKAIGSNENPILFTRNDTTGFYVDTVAEGGWKQIRVENVSSSVDSTIFSYCHFEYGKAVDQDSIHGYGGALCIRNSDRVAVTHCVFLNNYAYFSGGAIYLEHASVEVRNNSFIANRCGQTHDNYGYGGGICSDNGEAIIEHNEFNLNSSTGIGGGLCVRYNDGPVSFNVFEANYSALGGGIGMLHIDTCNYFLSNNLVFNNGAQFFGAGISNGDCSPTYLNNTIVDNHCIGGGGGFYCKDSVVPMLINNIIYGNTQYGGEANQVYLWDLTSQPNFYSNDIQGGVASFEGTGGSDFVGDYSHNIDLDPLFETGSFALPIISPCVNAGNPDASSLGISPFDLAGKPRVVFDTIDMGAFECQEVLGYVSEGVTDSPNILSVYPNPVTDQLHVEVELAKQACLRVSIIDLKGQEVGLITAKMMMPGQHLLTWNTSDLVKGSYVILFQDYKGVISRQIVKN